MEHISGAIVDKCPAVVQNCAVARNAKAVTPNHLFLRHGLDHRHHAVMSPGCHPQGKAVDVMRAVVMALAVVDENDVH